MRHVDHEQCADLFCDAGYNVKLYLSCICRCTGDYKFRSALKCDALQLIVIYVSLIIYTVGDKIVQLARAVDRGAMGEVSAVGKVHAHNGVAGIYKCKISSLICLCA